MAIKDRQPSGEGQAIEDIPTSPLPAASSPGMAPLPHATPPAPKRPRYRADRIRMAVVLVLLAILIIAGGLAGLRFLYSGPALNTSQNQNAPASAGPFVQPPLNDAQIDALHRLSSHLKYRQLASLYVSRMTLDEEIGQLIMVEYADEYYSPDLDNMISNLHAGGVIMYEFQMKTLEQTKHDIAEMQKHARLPLLVAADEEGGPYVHRLRNIYPPRMSATDIYNTGDANVAIREGQRVARELLSLGINVNLAPDVDVQLVPGYDLVTRTFGYSVDSVIKYAGAYMKAMQRNGVIACIKHYPGLGAASIDAHKALPVINRTKEQLYAVELAPYKYFVQSPDMLERPGMIMPTDVLMPAIDPVYPAELSRIFMTDILRKEFGYDGVVLTDALYMKGVAINGVQIDMAQAAVMALNAGNDMILGPTGSDQTVAVIQAIKTALQDGKLAKARLDEAAARIIALKMERGLMPAVPPS
ncbi:MAG: glycoside hydrolase family 3 [Ktedonobacteraceae bacterium]|nr:glycoside hydrolase family 3 [Ktedonobacteraceae bacterium]